MFEHIEFIRPRWLLAIIPALLFCWFFLRENSTFSNWQQVIEPHLLSRLAKQPLSAKSYNIFLLPSLLVLSIIALSGVSFFTQNKPVYEQQKTTLIILDASPSMNADDVVPSRLERAILLIKQFLAQDKNQTMLMAFAAEPYLISPPSIDDKPTLNLLQGFATDILPAAGSRLDLALKYAKILLTEQDTKADILLLTDAQNVSSAALKAAKQLGQKISIIAISKEQTVEFKHAGKNRKTTTNKRLLKLLAQSTDGLYQDLGVGNIDNFVLFNELASLSAKTKKKDKKTPVLVDNGAYIALLLLPLFLLFFAQRLRQ